MVEVELVGLGIGFTVEVKMAMVEVKVKKYLGRPTESGGWSAIGEVGVFGGVRWILYASDERKHGWRNMKLAAKGWAPDKANYWIGWNGERLAATSDQRKLETQKPELRNMLLEFIRRTPGL